MDIREIFTKLKDNLGLSISGFVHAGLFIALLINFPHCHRKLENETIITVDLLPIAKVTNVENKQIKEPEPKKEAKPEEKPKAQEKQVEKPEEAEKPIITPKEDQQEIIKTKPEPKKEKKEQPKKEIEPEDKPKPKQKPKEDTKKKTKPKPNDVDQILKNLEKLVQNNDLHEKKDTKRSKGPYRNDMPLSLSVKDSIRKQVEQHWSPPAGNKDASKLQIFLRITLKMDGSVSSVKVIDNIQYNNNEMYRVAADAAIRAVYKASPLQNLPIEQYGIWQDLEFDFDPRGILGD